MDFSEYEQLFSNIPNTKMARESFSIEELTNVIMNVPQSVVKTKTETIARIFGKTRAENFISDWLAFLMKHNPEVLRAIFQSADIPTEDLEFDVEREHVFSDGRRIDFLLTGENVIVGIENKIDSGKQDNQLEDYSKSLNQLKSDEKSVEKIFLKPASNDSEATHGFIEVTYERLLEELKSIPMDFILDLRGSFLLLDFIKHIEENIVMGNFEDFEFIEWTAFLSKHQEQIKTIMQQTKDESGRINRFIKDKMLAVVDYSSDWKLGNDKEALVSLYDTVESFCDSAERLEELRLLKEYLGKNWLYLRPFEQRRVLQGAQRVLGTCESNHRVYTFRMKKQGKYWSETGALAMAKLISAKRNVEFWKYGAGTQHETAVVPAVPGQVVRGLRALWGKETDYEDLRRANIPDLHLRAVFAHF